MNQQRMSPLTALILGIFGTGAVSIACGTTVVLYGLRIVDNKGSAVLRFVDNTVGGLPEIIEKLPPAVGDLLNDRRDPAYMERVQVQADLVADERGRVRPVLTVTNNGDRVITLMAVRVAALDGKHRPLGEWTEVVATPIAVDHDWRGPIMPGAKRYVIGSTHWRGPSVERLDGATALVEVSEIRVWRGDEKS